MKQFVRQKIMALLVISGLVSFCSAFAAVLPDGIQWQTNNDAPIFENYQPKKGGQLRTYILSYPQTFRLFGLNSNSGGFVSYNRMWSLWSLVTRHASTGEIIPMLATHWATLPDQKTAYFRLDPDARWSDGKKITASDYLFAYNFLQSADIQDPFYNQYIRDHYESFAVIDEYTIKIVAKKPSWRLLDEIDITPLPRHAIDLNKDWIKKAQWTPNVVPGPYVLKSFRKGQYVVFERIKNWWGENKRYFKNLYHFDSIRLDVVQSPDTAYALFQKEKLHIFSPPELIWAKRTDTPEIKKGYILKQRIKVESYEGARGFFFNSQEETWKDPNLRRAFALTIDFETMNKNLFYSLYQRKHHFFDVAAPYRDPQLRTYEFDLQKANDLLEKSGWKRNSESAGLRQKNGKTLELVITTGSENALRYLPFIKETAKKAGIDVKINKLDGAAFFDLINQRKFQVCVLGFGGSRFASPRQFLHTETMGPSTNNIFLFGSPQIDEWIETYQFDLNEKKRVQALFSIEKEIRDAAVYVPAWKENSDRILRWRYIKGPPGIAYKTGVDINLLYYDQDEKKLMENAMKEDRAFPAVPEQINPYNLP